MAAGDGSAREAADEVARRDLVRRVAHGKKAGHGEGGYLRLMRPDGGLERDDVERRLLVTRGRMTAGDEADGIMAQGTPEIGTVEGRWLVAQQQQADRAPLSLDDRVRRQRRR